MPNVTNPAQAHRRRLLRSGLAALCAMTLLATMVFPSVAAAQTSTENRITSEGIGKARLGSTPAQLRAQLGTGWTVTEADPILVDLFGYEVKKDGVVQFHALGDEGAIRLDLFVTENPAHQTAEGVGPETTIDDAVTEYGDATLSISEIEGREFVRFANGPDGRIFFRTGSGDEAGVYADGASETDVWKDGATIKSVWISCVQGQDCPTLAYTGTKYVGELATVAVVMIATGLVLLQMNRRREGFGQLL